MTKTLLNRALPPGVRLLIAAVLLWPSLEVMAQVPGSKLKDGTEVPDIGGIWERIEGIRFNPTNQLPPYNAEYRRRYDLAMEARGRGERVAGGGLHGGEYVVALVGDAFEGGADDLRAAGAAARSS